MYAQNAADKYNTEKEREESKISDYENKISRYAIGTSESESGNGQFDAEDIEWTVENSKGNEFEIRYIGNATELTLNSDEIKGFKYEWVENLETGKGKNQLTDEVVTIKLSEPGNWIGISIDAEEDCNVENLTISPNVMNLQNVQVSVEGIKKITFLEGIKTIPGYMCSEEEELTTVNLPSSLEIIGHGAFMGCSNLTQLNIPGGVTSMTCAFEKCTNLKQINFGGTMATWNNLGNQGGLGAGAQVVCSDGTITIQ